jgi:polyisoprenoid-binding protein YceI
MSTVELTRQHQGAEAPAPGTYDFDTAHSTVSFAVRHMMVSKVRGHLDPPSGSFTIAEDPTESSVEVALDWSTVNTGDEKRDAHLKSSDFVDVEKHPTISFSSTAVRHIKDERWAVDGLLTVQGVVKPVTLDLEFNGIGRDPWGNVKAGFSAKTKVNREDFGLTWNAALETGGVVVGKDVTIEIDVEASLRV